MRASSRTGFSFEPGLARNVISPASESGRSWLAAWSTLIDPTRQNNVAAVAPSAAQTRCMSWNSALNLGAQRKLRLHAQPLDRSARQPLSLRRVAIGQLRRSFAERAAQVVELGRHQRARHAVAQVALDGDSLLHRQFVVVEFLEAVLHVLAVDRVHHDRLSRNCCRRVCRARVSRDLTVPTATPSENAISS